MATKAKATEETVEVEAEAAERPVKDVIREMFKAGKSRSEIAKELNVSYQRVFSLTKGETNASTGESGARPKVILGPDVADGRFDGVARIEAIRTLFGEGLKVGEIAKLLGCSYQIVFQATRAQREEKAEAQAALVPGDEDEEAEDELESEESDEDDEDEDDEE